MDEDRFILKVGDTVYVSRGFDVYDIGVIHKIPEFINGEIYEIFIPSFVCLDKAKLHCTIEDIYKDFQPEIMKRQNNHFEPGWIKI